MKRLPVVLVVVSVFVASCGGQGQKVGQMRHETRSIQPENAKSVHTHLMMGAGELNVSGSADALMEADFDVSGDTGKLSVKQGSGKGVRIGGGARNEWDVRF